MEMFDWCHWALPLPINLMPLASNGVVLDYILGWQGWDSHSSLEIRRDTHQINCLPVPVGGSPYMLWVASASFTDDRLNLQGMSFSCNECGFHHRHKCHLTRHMRIHTQETFVCHVCWKPFRRRDKLNRHIIHKHRTIMDTKQAYPCSQCGKLFSRKEA